MTHWIVEESCAAYEPRPCSPQFTDREAAERDFESAVREAQGDIRNGRLSDHDGWIRYALVEVADDGTRRELGSWERRLSSGAYLETGVVPPGQRIG